MSSLSLYADTLRTREYHLKATAYYFRQWDDFRMPFHRHNSVEIMYVISGTCAVAVDTETDLISMKKGDFIVLDANVPHKLIVEKGSPCRMLNVEFTFMDKQGAFPSIKDLAQGSEALSAFLSNERPYFVLKDPSDVYHALKSLVLELDDRSTNNEWMVYLLLSQLLIRIARLSVEAGELGPQQADIYVKKAIAYLHHHYDCDIQIKDVASIVNLHPGYLHRIFKAHTGSTIMDYLTALRIDKAKMLLARTDIPVIEISDSIGINSSQYFSAIFKKHTGQTPLSFRKSIDKTKWDKSFYKK